jgi:hypothetical protein
MSNAVKNEEGASLILVIIFVSIFAIISAAILDLASTGLKMTRSIEEVRNDQNEIEGAVDGAINAIRSSNAGYTGEPGCLTTDGPVFTYEMADGDDVDVTCRVAGGSTGGVDDTMPSYAILTLGTGSCEGIVQLGNDTLAVDGSIRSNSKISTGASLGACPEFAGGAQSRLSVFGDIFAVGQCIPGSGDNPTRVIPHGQIDCEMGSGQAEPRPPYPAAASNISGMAIDPPASCGGAAVPATSIVRFEPGVYTEHLRHYVPAPCSTITNTAWWLSPGVYYFDFRAADSILDLWDSDPTTPGDQWKNLVAGTPQGWSANSLASAVSPPNAACDPDAVGAQIIFGGSSRIRTESDSSAFDRGEIEICGSARGATSQEIALYGLDTVSAPTPRTVVGANDAAARKVAPSDPTQTAGTWTNVPNARVIDDTVTAVATSQLDGNGTKIASLSYAEFEDVAVGSDISSVMLDVSHRETGSNTTAFNKLNPSVIIRFGSSSQTINLTRSSSQTTQSVDISSFLKTALRYQDVNALTVEYRVDGSTLSPQSGNGCPNGAQCTPSQKGTVTLDGVRLRVAHTLPGFQPISGATCASPSCALMWTTANPYVVIHGTVFAPSARLDLDLHNTGETRFLRGIIARTLHASACPCANQTDAPFSLPGLSNVRRVDFVATVNGRERLRARVQYTDTPVLGERVSILNWKVIR